MESECSHVSFGLRTIWCYRENKADAGQTMMSRVCAKTFSQVGLLVVCSNLAPVRHIFVQ